MAKVLLEKEVKAAQEDPNLGVSCGQDEEDALKVKVIIYGHLGTTYEGGQSGSPTHLLLEVGWVHNTLKTP